MDKMRQLVFESYNEFETLLGSRGLKYKLQQKCAYHSRLEGYEYFLSLYK